MPKTRIIIRMRPGHADKAKRVRDGVKNKAMKRRDAEGRVMREQKVT